MPPLVCSWGKHCSESGYSLLEGDTATQRDMARTWVFTHSPLLSCAGFFGKVGG